MASPKNVRWHEENGSYQARLTRKGREVSDSFSPKKYGTKRKALFAAKAWIAKQKKKLGPPAPSGNTPGAKTRRNRSGTVNVIFKDTDHKNLHDSSERWIAKLRGLKPSSLSWSVAKYGGEEEAYVLAVLSVQLRTTDREEVLAEFRRIRKRKAYRAIADRMSW